MNYLICKEKHNCHQQAKGISVKENIYCVVGDEMGQRKINAQGKKKNQISNSTKMKL